MPESVKLERARLVELEPDFETPKGGGKTVTVQFNPETLKVTFANQISTPAATGSQSGGPSQLFVGAGSTKLAVQLIFDVTALAASGDPPSDDVRKLTKEVSYFITPRPEGQNFLPPVVQFLWGSFAFAGIVEGLEETLEFFSSDGRPLRASLSLGLSQQKIQEVRPGQGAGQPGGAGAGGPLGGAGPSGAPPGTRPLTEAPAGASLQALAGARGVADWQAVAAANGIENPRLLAPGQLIDLEAGLRK